MNNDYDDDDDIDPYLNGPPPLVRGIGVNYAVNNPVDNDNPVVVVAEDVEKVEEKVEEEEVVDVAIK